MADTIAIVGLGTMGLGIVQVALQNGCKVLGYDAFVPSAEAAAEKLQGILQKLVDKSKLEQVQANDMLQRFKVVPTIDGLAKTNLVIEAVIENLDIKKKLFSELETVVSETCILATNTSSLSVTSIAAACANPQRVVGIHFFNPAPLMALVEIVPAVQTSDAVLAHSKSIIDAWGKTTVIAKDTPGFIVNRIARPYYSEAIKIYEEGIASKETIDAAMKNIGSFKMGPFELMDMIGHDVNYVVTETVWRSMFYDPRYKPSFTQLRLLEAKWLGRKTGKGFYSYETNAVPSIALDDKELQTKICRRVSLMLINEAADALYLNIASAQDIEIAMTKGVNYPIGLLQLANSIGIGAVVTELDDLYAEYHDDRYRCSALLRRMNRENTTFSL
jgi:3-hydroxybutyryl-CoA dehydrogenase